jgi:4-hydroxy-4-methyl-2-oxoglutarate aldolase
MSGIINSKIERPAKELIAEFEAFSTSIISDSMGRMNAMRAGIKPISEVEHVIAGPAVTVQCVVGDNLMIHQAIYIAQPGDVLVIDARGHKDTSVWGAIMTKASMLRGIKAVVIDGTARDLKECREMGLPIFCLGAVPAGSQKNWGGNINVVIHCGGVPVSPGDIIVGDNDGVVVVPAGMARDVLERAKERARVEEEWRKGLESGKTTLEVIGLDKKLKELGIRVDEFSE